MHERAAFDPPLIAEPEDLRVCSCRKHLRGLVFGIQDEEVLRRLARGNPRLGIGIALKGLVPVQMIGRDVEDHGDLRPELNSGLQLKARDLEHAPNGGAGTLRRIVTALHHHGVDVTVLSARAGVLRQSNRSFST